MPFFLFFETGYSSDQNLLQASICFSLYTYYLPFLMSNQFIFEHTNKQIDFFKRLIMTLIFWICLLLSFNVLANPILQNSYDSIPLIADNAEPAEDSNDSNFHDTMAGTNLISSPNPECTSDAIMDNEPTSENGIFRRNKVEVCSPDYTPNGAATKKPDSQREEEGGSPSGITSPDGICKDPKYSIHVTCGGPVVGMTKGQSQFHSGPFFTWVLNCFGGKFDFRIKVIIINSACIRTGSAPGIPRREKFWETHRIAEFCCQRFNNEVSQFLFK